MIIYLLVIIMMLWFYSSVLTLKSVPTGLWYYLHYQFSVVVEFCMIACNSGTALGY